MQSHKLLSNLVVLSHFPLPKLNGGKQVGIDIPAELGAQAGAEGAHGVSSGLGLPGLEKPFPLLAGKTSPGVDTVQSELHSLS